MGKFEVVIIIPAFNESETILNVVSNLSGMGDLLIIDDCSQDNTTQILEQNNINFLRHDKNLGYEEALASGIKYAKARGYKFLVTTDADGELSHEAIPKILDLLKSGSFLVVGQRNKKNRFIEIIFGMLSYRIFGVKDPLCGMKGYNLSLFDQYKDFDTKKMIGTEILAYCLRDQIKVTQTPIRVYKRNDESRFGGSLSSFFRISRTMLLFFRIVFLKN